MPTLARPLTSRHIVAQVAEFAEWKRQEDCKPKHFQSHEINRAIERLGPVSIGDLAKATGYTIDRIIEHVEHFVSLKTPKLRVDPTR
jgi:hypothetical protein